MQTRKLWRAVALVGGLMIVLVGAAAAIDGVRVVSAGDPFSSCVNVGSDSFGGVNYPNTEVEPWVASNPARPRNFVGSFQQDRWSDGGAKGLVAAWSFDGGRRWGETPLPFSQCAAPFYGGAVLPYDRASDPWNSIGPDGKSYAVSISFNGNDNNNAVGAATSSDGGVTWQNLRAVITDLDSDPTLPFNDKESVTADPLHPGYAYVVWDRLRNVPCGPAASPGSRLPVAPERPGRRAGAAAAVCFDGPTYFSRTTNGGLSWSRPHVIVPTPPNEQTIGNVIVVDQQTDVLYDFFTYIDRHDNFFVEMVHTLGAGNESKVAWSAPVVVAQEDAVGVFDPRNGEPLRTGAIIPEPAIDPASGQLYVVWEDARFNNEQNDQVVISMSARGGNGWTEPTLVNPPGDLAAFTPSVAVDSTGRVGVAYYALSKSLNRVPIGVLPTDYWFTQAVPPSRFREREHLFGPFNFKAAPDAGGFFLGDYEGLATTGREDLQFLPFFAVTNCIDTSCNAIGNPTGAPTGGPDPTDIVAVKVGGQGPQN
jgi:hypothetical protein